MRKGILVINIILCIMFLLCIEQMRGQDASYPLAIKGTTFFVEDTIELSINLLPEQYASYDLLISTANSSYTYKGDFSPIMFFYPTEEGIYTTALVEKSTGAIYYPLSFNVTSRKDSGEEGNEGIELPGSGMVDKALRTGDYYLANQSLNLTPSITPVFNYSGFEVPKTEDRAKARPQLIYIEKNDFLPGEKVRVLLDSQVVKEQERFSLYYVFNGSNKKYMGDFGFIEFTPEGLGANELLLTDAENNEVASYSFKVVDSIASKIIKVLNSAGASEEVSSILYDSSGKALSIGDDLASLSGQLNATYSLEITTNPAILKRLRLNRLRVKNFSQELRIGVDNVPSNRVSLSNKIVIKAFAIDPSGLDFDNGTATAVAEGTELWKCPQWDFEWQACLGEWEKIMNLTPGQEYSIELSPNDPGFAETAITIINVQSYPTYKGNWTVFFNTTGTADLVITPVDGTSWDYSSEPEESVDLRFLEVRCGNEVIPYEWIDGSAVFNSFSCDERAYETSQVLTVGVHTLEFKFGDDAKYAHNLVVYENWLQTLDAEFNNGTKTNINVSGDAFKLNGTIAPCIGSPSGCGSFSSNPPCSSTCGCTWTASYCFNNGACTGLAESPCSACPGCSWSTSSCPLVEAWNGSRWVAEHEAFPFSIFKSVSRTTYDSLPSLKCIDGKAMIRIYESLPEITFLEDFKAYAVRREDVGMKSDQGIKGITSGLGSDGLVFMKPDLKGRVRFINKQLLPNRCDSSYYSSKDCLELIKEVDKEFAEPAFNSSRIDDWLVLSFENVSAEDVKLYLVARKQNFLDAYYIYMVHIMGKNQFPFFSQLSALPGISWITNKWWEDSLFFQVELWDEKSQAWARQEAFGAGHQLPHSGGADDFLVSLKNPCFGNCSGSPLKVRLRFMTGAYGIDYVAIDDSLDPGFSIRELVPNSIIFSHKSSNETVKSFNRTMTKDDFFIVKYNCSEDEEIFISISGYYNHGEFDAEREKDPVSAWYEYIMLFAFGKPYVISTAQEKGLYKGAKSLCEFDSTEIEAQKRADGLHLLIAVMVFSKLISLIILFIVFKQRKASLICLLILVLIIVIIITGLDIPFVTSGGSCSGTLVCGNYNSSQSGCQGCSQCLWNPDTCSGAANNCSSHSSESNCLTCGCTWQPYFLNGSIISQAKDTGRANPVFTNIFITNSTPAGANISWALRAAATQAGLSSAVWHTNLSQVPRLRWVQWRINLSSNGSGTPVVYEVNVTWTFTDNAPNVTNLTYPNNGMIVASSTVSFNFTVVDDFNFTNCTLYGNFSGEWAANKTVTNVLNGSVNNITVNVPDGSFIWNVLCFDNFDTPQSDWYDYNYSVIVDTAYPIVDFISGTAGNGSYRNQAWVFANVSVIETNERNITFRLFNLSGPLNSTTLGAGNRSINFSGLADGTYYYNVTACDNATHCNSTQTWTIYLDNIKPVISKWSINGTDFQINRYICINATVNDSFAGVSRVIAQVQRPDLSSENITLLDNHTTSCDGIVDDGVYSLEYYLQFAGNYTWQVAYANDSAGNMQSNTTSLTWNVTTIGSMNVSMASPASDLEINESEYNYQYQQNCSVSCNPDGSNCTNVTLYAEYNPGIFTAITTGTTDLINNEDSFSCGNLSSGGASCTHTFNITSGSSSGNQTWLIRCIASSNNVGSFASSPVNLIVNDHPSPAIIYPQNNTWVSGTININASSSFDSDGTITNYLFEYDNSTAFISPTTICNSASSNCTWNTTQQDQCDNNVRSCYLRLSVVDDNGLGNSMYIIIGFDTNGPTTTLDRPANLSTVSGSMATVNASAVDSEVGNISTVVFEYRRNSTATWAFACNDDRGPIYECEWSLGGLPDGTTYEVRAYANDTFANIGGYDTHIGITLDNSPPAISLISPPDNSTDTDGDIVFVYQVSDLSAIANCSLIINSIINQTNSSVQQDTDQYFYLYGLNNGTRLNWSINCTDNNGLKNSSLRRNLTVITNSNMNITLSINRTSYSIGEFIDFVNNVTDSSKAGISNADVSTAIIFANTTMPWWNSSWQRRKPITLSSSSSLTNVMIEVNITGLSNNITSCANEIRIVRLTSAKDLVSVNRTAVGGDNANFCVVRFRANVTAGVNNTDYYAYYNNSAATNPANNESRLVSNTTRTAIGGSIMTTGAGYNVVGGSYLNTTNDDGAYYAVGRDNGAFSGTDLGAYINLSFNSSVTGISKSDFVAFNFTINYCHTNDITAPITCSGASPGTANNPANAELYNFDSTSWIVFDSFFQDTGSANERNDSLYNNSGLSSYIQDSTNLINVRFETDVVLGTGGDTSFALDYAGANLFYLERAYSIGTISSTELLVASNSSTTSYNGLWSWNWSTTGQASGNYSAVSLATKIGYNNDYDYVRFALGTDTSAPVVMLISPADNNYTSGNVSFRYNVSDPNSGVANCSLIINGSVQNTTLNPQKDATLNFTVNGLADGAYNWSVNCTDPSGNQNSSVTRKLNIDSTGPVSVLDRPQNNTIINAITDGFIYAVNASVTDSGIGNISVVTFIFRYNSTSNWSIACRDNDTAAPYGCSWNLTGLSNGHDYEVMVYANDSLGNTGANDTHANITIITQPILISSIILEDDISIPINQLDLQAGTTKSIYCNITVTDSEVYTNILGVNATIYSLTTTYGAADSNRTHYTNSSCTFITGGGASADYLCAFNVWHFAINGTWNCTGNAWNSYAHASSSDNSTVNQLFALNISTSVINYTSLQASEISPNITVNISNVGNMPMNISVYGFGGENETSGAGLSMVCEINNISISFQRFATDSDSDYASKNALDSTPQGIGLTIPSKESADEMRVNSTYWQLMIPPESQSFGRCNGSVVFVAESP